MVAVWNEEKYTLALALNMFQGQYGSYYGQLMAASTLMILPIIVIFFFGTAIVRLAGGLHQLFVCIGLS